MEDEGKLKDHHASLAKAFCTVRMRETVAWARELLGGNGILLEEQVARFFADAEALYSYEGTREMNTLIVGKAITGFSAFVYRKLGGRSYELASSSINTRECVVREERRDCLCNGQSADGAQCAQS